MTKLKINQAAFSWDSLWRKVGLVDRTIFHTGINMMRGIWKLYWRNHNHEKGTFFIFLINFFFLFGPVMGHWKSIAYWNYICKTYIIIYSNLKVLDVKKISFKLWLDVKKNHMSWPITVLVCNIYFSWTLNEENCSFYGLWRKEQDIGSTTSQVASSGSSDLDLESFLRGTVDNCGSHKNRVAWQRWLFVADDTW